MFEAKTTTTNKMNLPFIGSIAPFPDPGQLPESFTFLKRKLRVKKIIGHSKFMTTEAYKMRPWTIKT